MSLHPYIDPRYRLCFIDPNSDSAWFVAGDPRLVSGDDWSDAPYEHNASEPYHYTGDGSLAVDGEVFRVLKFSDGDYQTPAQLAGLNSSLSVNAINARHAVWLRPWAPKDNKRPLYAGATMPEFVDAVDEAFLPLRQALATVGADAAIASMMAADRESVAAHLVDLASTLRTSRA